LTSARGVLYLKHKKGREQTKQQHMKHELKIRNLIARVFFGETNWRSCDIPTREAIDEFISKLGKINSR